MERMLVVKLSGMSGALMITPALRALGETFPNAECHALICSTALPILKDSPVLNRLFPLDCSLDGGQNSSHALPDALSLGRTMREHGYDAVVLMHHLGRQADAEAFAQFSLATGAIIRAGLDNGHGWFLTHQAEDLGPGAYHEVEYCLQVAQALGASTNDTSLSIPVSRQDERNAQLLMSAVLPAERPLIALHPGAGDSHLRWPADRFAQTADALVTSRDAEIVLVGRSGDDLDEIARAMRHRALNLINQTTVRQAAAVLKQCDLLITNDSAMMHLATAVRTPVVALFGPSDPRARGPWGGRHEVVSAEEARDQEPETVAHHTSSELLNRVTVEMVLVAAERLLADKRLNVRVRS